MLLKKTGPFMGSDNSRWKLIFCSGRSIIGNTSCMILERMEMPVYIYLFAAVLLLVLILTFVLFLVIFYAPNRKQGNSDAIRLPEGEIYRVFWEDMRRWAQETRALPFAEMSVTSFDGLKLYGKYYECIPGAPVELMFHGYRGSAERDLSGGVQRCFQVGHNALLVDQRCSGKSEGHVISFGINEHRDCLTWIDHIIERFGPDVQIILTGISMGASTVLMASGKALPRNVIGVLADCGFHSPKEIILSVAKSMHLPAHVLYPFVKLGAKLFGRFDLEEYTPLEAMKTCSVPVIFFHGMTDDYVPCYMSRINYDACRTRKKLVCIPGAGHGLAYPVAPREYLREVADFFDPLSAAL